MKCGSSASLGVRGEFVGGGGGDAATLYSPMGRRPYAYVQHVHVIQVGHVGLCYIVCSS